MGGLVRDGEPPASFPLPVGESLVSPPSATFDSLADDTDILFAEDSDSGVVRASGVDLVDGLVGCSFAILS